MHPKVTLLKNDPWSGGRYRLVGGDIAPDWAVSWGNRRARGAGSPEIWCEVTLPKGPIVKGMRCSSYGGEVWPGAWPELFYHVKGSAQYPGGPALTEAGAALFRQVTEAT